MEIAPNSTIVLYSGMPLDPTYKNTLWFQSGGDQIHFFFDNDGEGIIYHKETFTNQYYTRVNRHQIKLKRCADDIYDCNYLAFKNTAYGNKWFFAFITSIEWINNEVSLLTFEIDVMQTYMFNSSVKQCFVEREHSEYDYVGYNTVEEDLFLGDAYVEEPTTLPFTIYFLLDGYIILANETGTGDTPTLTVKNNMPVGLDVHCDGAQSGETSGQYSARTIAEMNVITQYKGGEHIVSAYAVPTKLLNLNGTNNPTPYEEDISVRAYPDKLDGYIPKNNKMFTSQFCKLYCSNNGGSVVEYKNELFDAIDNQGLVTFKLLGTVIPSPEVICVPTAYRHVGIDYDNAISINDFPPIPFTGDVYKAYVATKTGSNVINALTSILGGIITGVASGMVAGGAIGGVAGGAIGGAVSTVRTTADMIGNYVERDAAPNNTKNMVNLSGIKAAHNRYAFTFYHTTIKREYAEIIDSFFSMYGYAVKKVKVPNEHVRREYTYTKTADCTIVGHMPADDIIKMQNIYNNGVTFWVHAYNVGDYSVNNAPIT